MSDGITQQIKDKVDVVDLIGSYIKLQKAGANYRARCPFHNEKSASFYVSPERAMWHCFGCGVGGDIFSFIQQMEGVEFPDALRTLADRAGVVLESFDGISNNNKADAKTTLYKIVDSATMFFEKQLWNSNAGVFALEYLRERGLKDETIKLFRLGYAPQTWDGLSGFLMRSFDINEIVDAGVAIGRENKNGCYDRFRSRIMFPLIDAGGRIVGFSGRIFHSPGQIIDKEKADQEAKYVNTPQTAIYDKSKILYGFDKAKTSIRSLKRCLVVEGNVDVVLSQQAGAYHTVATCGTALTDFHVAFIKRYADQIDLCFDTDNAGVSATEKAILLCLTNGVKVNALVIDDPQIKDPADFVKKYPEEWKEKALSAKPFMEYIFETGKRNFNITTPEGKKQMCERILPYVAVLQSRIERSAWVSRLAIALRLPEKTIVEEMAKAKILLNQSEVDKNNTRQINQSHTPVIKSIGIDLLEENLIAILLSRPNIIKNINLNENEDLSLSDVTLCVMDICKMEGATPKNVIDLVVKKSNPQLESLTRMLDLLYVKSQELWSEFSDTVLENEVNLLLTKIRRRDLSVRLNNLEYDIKIAEQDNDRTYLAKLLSDFTSLSRQMDNPL